MLHTGGFRRTKNGNGIMYGLFESILVWIGVCATHKHFVEGMNLNAVDIVPSCLELSNDRHDFFGIQDFGTCGLLKQKQVRGHWKSRGW